MARKDPGPQVDRRKFLTGVAAAGAATAAATMSTPVARAAEPPPAPRVPSALRPTLQVAAAETATPRETTNRIGGKPGSDFMVDVVKTLGIKYLPANCASSYRGQVLDSERLDDVDHEIRPRLAADAESS